MSGAEGDAENDPAHDAPRERHVEVQRTARYFTLGDASLARTTWVAIHGYGQLARYFARHFAPHARERLVIVPEALSRFYLESREGGSDPAARVHGPRVGATWMTREDRDVEIADYVRWLDRALDDAVVGTPAERAPLCVLAFSQGTATATRWLQHRARRGLPAADRVVLWAGDLPPDVDLAGGWLRGTRLTLVHSPEDPFATPARVGELCARLDDAGIAHERVRYVGGHRMPGEVVRDVLGA